jgi:serine/threonine protein kinase
MDSSTSMSEENRFARQYVLEEKPVGEGTYGAVYKGRCTLTGRTVAIKKMKPVHEEEGVPSTAIREVAVLKGVDHANIVRMIDVYCALGKIHVVFEFIDQNLKEYMRRYGAPATRAGSGGGALPPDTVCNFHAQHTKGIHFLHAHRIIHRDLKPQNILISNEAPPALKIADFGMARAYSLPLPKYTHEVVTTWYRAPEILFGSQEYALPIDMWSAGCILGEMAIGTALFRGDSEIDTIFQIFQKLGTPTEVEWPGLTELPDFKLTFPKWRRKPWSELRNADTTLGPNGTHLLDELLRYDPRRRLSAKASLLHPYIGLDGDVSDAAQP